MSGDGALRILQNVTEQMVARGIGAPGLASVVRDDPGWDNMECTRRHVALMWQELNAGVTASNGNGNGEAAESDNEVSTGLGSQDAAEDVEVTDCGVEPNLGWATATVTITNNSSGRSDYLVTVAFETDDGATRIDEGLASATNIEPDQVSEVEAPSATEAPEDVECRIVEVQRTASN